MPCDYKNYPSNWKTEIRPAILARDENKCKFCGLENYVVGYRDGCGDFHKIEPTMQGETDALDALAWGFKLVKIVITVAHLDNDTNNNDEANLAALCQKCHNNHDKKFRQGNAAKTRQKNKRLQNLF